jgi:hypothetical protein
MCIKDFSLARLIESCVSGLIVAAITVFYLQPKISELDTKNKYLVSIIETQFPKLSAGPMMEWGIQNNIPPDELEARYLEAKNTLPVLKDDSQNIELKHE